MEGGGEGGLFYLLLLVNIGDLTPVRLLANDGDAIRVLGKDFLRLRLPLICKERGRDEREGGREENIRKKNGFRTFSGVIFEILFAGILAIPLHYSHYRRHPSACFYAHKTTPAPHSLPPYPAGARP